MRLQKFNVWKHQTRHPGADDHRFTWAEKLSPSNGLYDRQQLPCATCPHEYSNLVAS